MSLKLIVALDFDKESDALSLIESIDPNTCALKVGSELFTRLGAPFLKKLIRRQFKVFLDLKFHDIPTTVARACTACAELGVWMLNVHAIGGLEMMVAAREALVAFGKERPLLIAVTILTSMSEKSLPMIGIERSTQDEVSILAKLTAQAGLDGVVCSAQEVAMIKSICGKDFLTVTPGIRLPNSIQDDQARVLTPSQALREGSDYLVIGRPVTRATNPRQILKSLVDDIESLCNQIKSV